MAERPIDQLPLREMLIGAEQLSRELCEHLEKSFAPKVHALNRLVASHAKIEDCNLVQDITVRKQCAIVMQSDDFSQPLFKKLNDYLDAIERTSNRALSES